MTVNDFGRIIYSAPVLLLLMIACSSDGPNGNDDISETSAFPVDTLATPETVALLRNLQSISSKGILFGHQDDIAYGVNWWAEPGRSDVKEVCGDYPAVYGWDLGDIHQAANLDGVNFLQMIDWIEEAYARGGIITISVHLDNPVTGGDAWDNTPAIASILPDRPHHNQYLSTLDLIAAFLKSLKMSSGTHVPVIFRPYHEHNHTWSWWGKESCTADEYNALWRMTIEYFRDVHEIHHLLYAISPQEIKSAEEYFERYPGDDYVDILGLDYYKLYDSSFVPSLGAALHLLSTLAEERGKVSALTEVGHDKLPINNWWTDYLLAAINYSDQSKKTVWSLVWRNASKDHHFAPYQGHPSAPDFRAFYNNPFTIFENDLPDMYHIP